MVGDAERVAGEHGAPGGEGLEKRVGIGLHQLSRGGENHSGVASGQHGGHIGGPIDDFATVVKATRRNQRLEYISVESTPEEDEADILHRDGRIEMCTQNAFRYWERIAYDEAYGGLALSAAEGDRMCRAMADKDILFLRNHGVVVSTQLIAGLINGRTAALATRFVTDELIEQAVKKILRQNPNVLVGYSIDNARQFRARVKEFKLNNR